ncbi:MAG: segregation/condensation protein A [Planctomycetota bacterium]
MSIGKDHRVELEKYSGPLDLLLYLIREEEVDVHDIPIARILERYLEILHQMESLDLDQAGEFLVIASLMMQIKSRSLLPRDDPLEDEELDPRFELVQMLLEYRRFKEASEELKAKSAEWEHRFAAARGPDLPGPAPDEVPVADVSVWDLAVAFQRLMDEVGVPKEREIVYDDTPVEVHMDEILDTIGIRDRIPFRELFPKEPQRHLIAGLFVALLELIKQRRIRAVQEEPFAPILVERREAEPEAAE